jgi:cyanophycin synthetase
MRILDRSVYVGPSLYARFPVIRLELDLGELEAWPTGRLGQEFVAALAAALPGLAEHGCSYQVPGGLLRRMREDEGTWLGHVLEHVAIELHRRRRAWAQTPVLAASIGNPAGRLRAR